MPLEQTELDRFHQFATERIASVRIGECAADREGVDSIYELLAEWELESLTDNQLQRNAQAIQKSIDDMEAGDLGRPARQLIAELRNKMPHQTSG